MSNLRIPNEWFPMTIGALAEDGFSVRFDDDTTAKIKHLATFHGVSRATIVRFLVNRALAELQRPSRVA